MSDTDVDNSKSNVLRIPRFHGRRGEDYGLWRLRLRAACRVKGVWHIVSEDTEHSTATSSASTALSDADKHKLTSKKEKASGIIISALGDSPLRVVAEADGEPARMLALLDARYASSRTVSRIAVQTQLFRMRYTGQDMSRYIDEYVTLFSQLEFMGKDIAVPEAHKAPMLLASIDPDSDMESIAAALRTKDAKELTWEYVTTTMIDEFNSKNKSEGKAKKHGKKKFKHRVPRHQVASTVHEDGSSSDGSVDVNKAARAFAAALNGNRSRSSSTRSDVICEFCNKNGHTESYCYLNPDNPNNRLSSRMKERMMIAAGPKKTKGSGSESTKRVKDKKVELAGAVLCSNVEDTEVTTVRPPKDHCTYYDSGATTHVFYSEEAFVPGSIAHCAPKRVLLADKSSVTASKRGEVMLSFEHINIRLGSVLLVPDLGYNLVSVGRLADNGIESLFRKDDVQLRLENSNVALACGVRDRKTGLYSLPSPNTLSSTALGISTENDINLWHRRLAHVNTRDLTQLFRHAHGVPQLRMTGESCTACKLGKAHKQPFPGNFKRADAVGDVVHSDIVGPIEMSYPDHYRYFATFQDDFSRYVFVAFMQRKSDLSSAYQEFSQRFAELGAVSTIPSNAGNNYLSQNANLGSHIKKLHSDQGKEYVHLEKELGSVEKSYSPPYTPELNAVAERVNRTIEDASRSLLLQAKLPTSLWPYAVKYVVFVRNRVQHSTTKATPHLLVNGQKPSLKHARVFGCAAYVLKFPHDKKFDARAEEGILLEVMKYGVYKVLVKRKHGLYNIVESRHVTFDEDTFPGVDELDMIMDDEESGDNSWVEKDLDSERSYDTVDVSDGSDFIESEDAGHSMKDNAVDAFEEDSLDDEDGFMDAQDGGDLQDGNAEDIECESDEELCENEEADHDEDYEDSEYNKGKDTNKIDDGPSSRHRYPRRVRKPPSDWFMSASPASIEVTTADDPTLGEALKATLEEREAWMNAIDDEFRSIENNHTWVQDDLPDAGPLPTHVVLNVKRDSAGKVDRFKARMVAGGNYQVYGENYSETYAPVVDFSVVRLFLYMVVSLGLAIVQVDVKTAFLNGDLEEDIWVMSPRNIPGRPSRVYKLKKALYGLKQAHLAWHKKLCADLMRLGFNELQSASCVFQRKKRNISSYILVYVDDLLVVSQTEEEVQELVSKLETFYKLRRSTNVELFLGTRIQWHKSQTAEKQYLSLSQAVYIQSVLRRFGMAECKPAITPMIENFYSGYEGCEDKSTVNTQLYQQMIGSLLYLALRTRPDILVPVLILARFQQKPSEYCHRGAKRIMRYLKGTVNLGIFYKPGTMELHGFVDADYAADMTDRKSMSGYITKLGSSLIGWGARKQASVALSTCEAEYFALSVAAQEIIWMRKVLMEIGFPPLKATPLRSDNQSGISWAVGEKLPSRRAKHIDVRVHYIRDVTRKKEILVQYIPTDENDADLLTKPLPRFKFKKVVERLGLNSAVEEEC